MEEREKREDPKCEDCLDAKYVQKDGKYVQCRCLRSEKTSKRLGSFASYTLLPKESKLEPYLGKDILIFGDRSKARQHIARILRDQEDKKCYTVQAQSLLDLNFDNKNGGQHRLLDLRNPLWILFELGVNDVPNRYLPELLISVLASRKVQKKMSWVYCGRSERELKERYVGSSGENLADFFKDFMDETVRL